MFDLELLQPEVSDVSETLHLKLWDGFNAPLVAGSIDGEVFDYSMNDNAGVIDKDDTVTVYADRGFSFDGADSLITVAADTTIDVNGRTVFTLSAWINVASDGEGNLGRIMNKTDGTVLTTGYSFNVREEVAGFVKLYINVQHAVTDMTAVTDDAVIPIDTWTHVAATYNESADGKGKLYVNGTLITSTDQAGNVIGTPSDDSADDLVIGNSVDLDRTFDGSISDVRFFNTARTAAQIRDLYNQTRWRYGV